MAPHNVNVLVYYNGQCFRNNNSVFFQSDERRGFLISMKSNIAHLKERISKKLNLGDNKVISEILYRQPVIFGSGIERFESYKIIDDEDVKYMFATHRQFEALSTIELYVTFEDVHLTHPQQINPQFQTHLDEPQSQPEFESQPSSSDYAQYFQLLQQDTSHFESQPSSSAYAPYHQSHQNETSHFHSQPSSSTYAPYTCEEEQPDIQHEEVGDESENEEEYVAQIYGNGDDNDDNDDDEPTYNPTPLRAYNPPSHMLTMDLATIDQPTQVLHSEQQSLPVDGEIEVGMQFHTKGDCVRAIKQYHIRQSLDYLVEKSDTERYVIKCKYPQCKFSLRAAERKKNKRWIIARITDIHTCISLALSQDHRKLDSNIICDSIVSLLHKDLSVKVKVIIAHIREKFNYTITYRKAWIAKNKAIEKMYGSWVDSYHALPQWLMAMNQYLPETVILLETLPTSTPGDRIFHRLFWSFNPLIQGFAFCKPIVQVDGTWLYGKYKGTLLLAVAQDGNNHIFPVAFAIVEGETKEAWNFFLKNLRTYVTPQPDICLISDRHASIKSAYDNPENGWNDPPSTHVYCIRHIAQNFMREIKDKQLRKLVVNMGYAVSQPTFQYYRKEIASTSLDALRWVDALPREKWTQAYDEGRRWGHMTSNLAESMNSVFKDIRNEPITALVQSTYYKCVALFQRRATQSAAVLQSGQDYTEACQKRIADAMHKANTHQVTNFDRHNHTFSVKETVNHNEGRPMGNFKVDLRQKWCDCGKFQALHLPCSHVIAACSHVRQAYQVHIHEVYKAATVYCVYNKIFPVIQDKSYWPQYQGPKLWPNPEMKRNKRGRPQSTRITTEMDDSDTMQRCGLCRVPGHRRDNCPNAG